MGAMPYILGGGLVLLVVAAASKAKSSTASSSTSSSTTTPTASTTNKPTSGSVPVGIVEQILSTRDTVAAQSQRVWLRDNGYPKTAFALVQWLKGEITDAQLRSAAATETGT